MSLFPMYSDYTIGDILYQGNFGNIVEISSDNFDYPLVVKLPKKISGGDYLKKDTIRELATVGLINGLENVLVPVDIVSVSIDNTMEIGLVFPRLLGNLKELRGDKSIDLLLNIAIEIFPQLINGLYSLHERGIFLMDIKMENILYNTTANGKYDIYYNDYGLALHGLCKKDDTYREFFPAVRGTPLYFPYEMVTGVGFFDESEIYMIGILVFMFIFGIEGEKYVEKYYNYYRSGGKGNRLNIMNFVVENGFYDLNRRFFDLLSNMTEFYPKNRIKITDLLVRRPIIPKLIVVFTNFNYVDINIFRSIVMNCYQIAFDKRLFLELLLTVGRLSIDDMMDKKNIIILNNIIKVLHGDEISKEIFERGRTFGLIKKLGYLIKSCDSDDIHMCTKKFDVHKLNELLDNFIGLYSRSGFFGQDINVGHFELFLYQNLMVDCQNFSQYGARYPTIYSINRIYKEF